MTKTKKNVTTCLCGWRQIIISAERRGLSILLSHSPGGAVTTCSALTLLYRAVNNMTGPRDTDVSLCCETLTSAAAATCLQYMDEPYSQRTVSVFVYMKDVLICTVEMGKKTNLILIMMIHYS